MPEPEPPDTNRGPTLAAPVELTDPGTTSDPGAPRRARAVAGALAAAVIGVAVVLAVMAVNPAGTQVVTAPMTTAPPSSTTSPADPESRATAVAAGLLSRVQVDPTWTPGATAPVALLAAPPSVPGVQSLVMAHRIWTTTAPWTDVQAWLAAHPPDGLVSGGSGSMADRSGPTLRDVSYLVHAGEWNQALLVSSVPLPGGGTGIRADAEVIWLPTRPTDAMVPAGETRVTVTVTWAAAATPNERLARTFTDRATVVALARTVNGLAMAELGEVINCPLDVGLAYRLRFTGPGAPVVSVVSVDCPGTQLTVGTRPVVSLQDGPTLLSQEAHLLGTTADALNTRALRAATGPIPTPATNPTSPTTG